MEKRTAEIVMVLKGHHEYGELDTYRDHLTAYMSDRCDYPADKYTDEMLFGIVQEAVKDYMSGCTGPAQIRCFLYSYFEAHKWHDSELTQWLAALSQVQVKEKNADGTWRYINGFTEENTAFVYKSGVKYEERYEIIMTSDAFPDPEDAYAIWDNKYNKYYTDILGDMLTFPSEEEAEEVLVQLKSKK